MKSRHATAILNAYKSIHAQLCKAGLRPQLQRLDNECSAILKACMHDQDIDFQLVPPAVHRRNAAERAIRTFKSHLITGLFSLDPKMSTAPLGPVAATGHFQPEFAARLASQSKIICPFRNVRKFRLQSNAHRTTWSLCRRVHEKPDKRSTWSPQGIDG